MKNNKTNPTTNTPSAKSLIYSSIITFITAMAILFMAILPAEYGYDPTGIGKSLGLTKMGEIKTSLANELEAENEKVKSTELQLIEEKPIKQKPVETPVQTQPITKVAKVQKEQPSPKLVKEVKISAPKAAPINIQTTQFTLKPNAAKELKVALQKNEKVSYEWRTNGPKVNFDVHGDSAKLGINYHNYSKGSETKVSSEIIAAFDGNHGWFWRNRSGADAIITLTAKGDSGQLKEVK